MARSHRCLLALQALLLAALTGCQPPDAATGPATPHPGMPHPGVAGEPRSDAEASGALLRVRSVHVQDGDSFIAATAAGARLTVRLNGVDAPERSQPYADRSRRNLRQLLDGEELRIRVATTDRFGRAVGEVYVVRPGGKATDAGLAQVSAGLAWYFRRYARDLPAELRERYAQAESRAREARAGLWHDARPEAPWDFRRRNGNRPR